MKRYVIVGNGAAAAGCVEGIRAVDAAGEIVVISEENRPVYGRPLISYYLEGKTDLSHMDYRGADFYEKNGCRVLYGQRAVSLDPESHTVRLDDETELDYGALCVATGSSPFVPPFEGLETVAHKFSFMTLDDAMALKRAAKQDSRVLIVGAGLIGLKCAEGLAGSVGEITVCDLADRVLSSVLDAECAAMMQCRLEANGIRFLLGDSAARFEGNSAVMRGGCRVDFDILVLCVGVRANTALVKNAGGEVGRGIAVDEKMRTSLADIYAAGDCTESVDISSGTRKIMALMPNAYMQGHAAGVNMAGGCETFGNAIPMNSVGFFGLHAMTAGSYDGEVYEEKDEERIRRLYVKDGLLKGFMLIGGFERAGIYTALIRDKTPLAELDFELLKTGATTAAFPTAERKIRFGGAVS